jgi:GTPase SAR1 family protein
MEKSQIIAKVCLLGLPAVGKTQLIRRHVLDEFDSKYIRTLGVNITRHNEDLTVKKKDWGVIDMIWELNGSMACYRTGLYDAHMGGAKGAFITYDSTDMKTVENLSKTIDTFFKNCGKMPVVFIANKVDLEGRVAVEEKVLSAVASEYDADYFYASAKTGKNVGRAFHALNKAMINAPPYEPKKV